MKRWRPQTITPILCALILLVYVANTYFHRPLFCNRFGWHPDRGLLPYWHPLPLPSEDEHGNVANWDFPTDLVVVMASGQAHYDRYPMVRPGADGFLYIRSKASSDEIRFPVARNCLIVIDVPNKTSETFALAKGQAKKMWRSFEDDKSDLRSLSKRFGLSIIAPTPLQPLL